MSRTFGNGEKRDERDSVALSASSCVMHEAVRQVQWIILILTGRNGHGRFVAA